MIDGPKLPNPPLPKEPEPDPLPDPIRDEG